MLNQALRTLVRLRPTIQLLRVSSFTCSVAKQKMQFKAETKRLLDIVAKSLYTDSEVFLRELLSNASDALEKQRFTSQSSSGLGIKVELNQNKNTITITDNGIGMTKQQLIDNLGTIAKSGSKQFVSQLNENKDNNDGTAAANIIGQFGVGFYSSFIVADKVEVLSRTVGNPAYLWSSQGAGQFQIQEVADCTFERGTQITLYLKSTYSNFTESTNINKIAQKYSNFLNFPISVNGQALNLVKPLWTRSPKEITDLEYEKFFEFLTNNSSPNAYLSKIHISSQLPLVIKSVLYIPNSHTEKLGLGAQQSQVSLYCKKVLIKKDCKQLLPSFLRFVKGVVDCEDLPLNISRENYQDSALMAKLRLFLSRKIIKNLKEILQQNPEAYNRWFKDFFMFIKQGSINPELGKQVVELNKYEVSTVDGFYNLQEYVKLKLPTQDRIFYFFSPSKIVGKQSPYLYPLLKAGIPVIIVTSHADQIVFRELDTFEGLKFSNIQTDSEDVERAIKGVNSDTENKEQSDLVVDPDQITPFSLWIKNQLQPYVDKVQPAKRQIKGSALVISPISATMRYHAIMRNMMENKIKQGKVRADLRNLTFEFNKSDKLMVKLNIYRKTDPEGASMIIKQIFDNACIEAGIQDDNANMIKRINQFLTKIVEQKVD